MTPNEPQLIRRAKRGDASALAEIYEMHQPAIYRYVYYRVEDEAIAAELTGDVFVRMVTRIESFSYRGRPLLTWLYTIARNLVLDHQRRAGLIPMLPLDAHLATEAESVEREVGRRLSQAHLAKALEKLTEDQRQVILLKFIGGLGNKEVAHILEKTEGAVKSLQHRGLAALRRALETPELNENSR